MFDILLPQAGQSMEEGTIVKWHKAEGDTVKASEILLEVETDKAVVEVEAGHDGVVRKILVSEGSTVPVKTRIALIGAAGEALPADLGATPAAKPATPQPAAAPVAAPAAASPAPVSAAVADVALKASPAARKQAAERGLDLASAAPGSGPGGRVTTRDLPAAGAKAAPAPAAPVPAAAPGTAIRRKLTGMRKAIARNLQASKQTVPHFYMKLTINAAPLMACQREEKAKYPCSINDFITKACAVAIREFPAFRSRIENEELVELADANIGIAVGMPDGLVVPVLQNADSLAIRQVASETRRIVEAARSGKIENMGKGVFTITNLGMFGIEEFTAIINPPESAILAVGAARETVLVHDGAMWPGKVMTLTLSADHRVVDGLPAAKFMARLKELLETPAGLI